MARNEANQLSYENRDVELITSFERKGYRTSPILFINGKQVPYKLVSRARSNQTLLSFLRDVMLLTGSKLGCAEGGCGACSVMISKNDIHTNAIKHYSVNACLMPVLAADGCNVTTIEGIGTVKGDNLHPIQKAMVDMHGSQCGFCTPGIIVAIYSIFANNTTTDYLEEHLDGNLCRCTGYRPIFDAARSLCDDAGDNVVRGPCGTPCRECPEREECAMECSGNDKAAQQEEKKLDPAVMCCSSSLDKVGEYKESILNDKNASWLDQPKAMFPKGLLGEDLALTSELVKPLVVVDRSDFHSGGTWLKPTTLVDLLNLLSEFGSECKIVVGNTEVGIETRFKHASYHRVIFPSESIETLFSFSASSSKITIGSCASLSTIQHECLELTKDARLARTAKPIHDMLRWFASSQIRNVACLAGNLVTASPISDMNPMLAAMGSKIIISSMDDDKQTVLSREVAVSDFFVKYRTVDLKSTELVQRVEVPVINEVFEYIRPFKQARRREDDISIVTSCMRMQIAPDEGKWVIKDAALAFGGMAPTTVLASKTASTLIGSELCSDTFARAREVALNELTLPEVVPGGQAAFRLTLVASFLYKFYLFVVTDLKTDLEKIKADPSLIKISFHELPPAPSVDYREVSGLTTFVDAKKPSIVGTQIYPPPKAASGLEDKTLPPMPKLAAVAASGPGTVGKASPHQSGPLHCTGEALYTDDIPMPPGTLQACLVLASECGGVFKAIDATPALDVKGVVAVFTDKDIASIGGSNKLGPIVKDEIVFLSLGAKVQTVGQVLGVVVAESLESAELGARFVKVEYEEPMEKMVVSIEDAIEAQSYYEFARHSMERGDPLVLDRLSDTAEGSNLNPSVGDIIKVSGSFRCPGQDHFYLETMTTLVMPSESDTNLNVYCSTQAATKTQKFIASATGTPEAKVVVHVKRMGGAFGGKETRTVFSSCAAAVAAKILCRPVRLTLSRETDMSITGGRHAFISQYCASALITEEGAKLHALDVKLFVNGGWAFDLTGPVLDRALFHVDGCYFWPNFRAEGVPCKTSQPAHTAFRGFGGPQGIAVCEHIVEHLAVACKVPYDRLRRTNMYREGELLPFGMVMGEGFSGKWNVPTMWDRLYTDCDVAARRTEIKDFNRKSKWLKRGIALLPTKFGIAYTAKFMNQGGALVHLYTDGTVLVTHGGTEMGQGLHTKVCQVTAQAFGIPLDDVYVNETSTDKVANTIPTAASMSTDTYGMATLDACRQILARLEPIRERLGPDSTLREVANAAHLERIDLSAHGFFALDNGRCGYDWAKPKPEDFPCGAPPNSWKGHPFNYFTQGVVCTEIEVEVLTGNHRTIRSDILMDVGSSINPSIDIGQIEGAFTQGMGWSTIEEVIYADDDHTWIRPRGKTFTTGPGTYKIPAFNDAPESFNVTLMSNVDSPFAVHSSKAIGEPPFFLGSSVFYAVKEAVRAARFELLGDDAYFEMNMPGTSERIRMQCADSIAEQAAATVTGKKKKLDRIRDFQAQGSY